MPTLVGLSLSTFISPVIHGAGSAVSLTGSALSITLHDFRRFWVPIFSVQVPNTSYDDVSIASNPICYTPPEPNTDPNVQGNWYTIATTEEGHDPTLWVNIDTAQDDSWTNIQT